MTATSDSSAPLAVTSAAVPLYFGTPVRPLFGWFHFPSAKWSGTRIVICNSLGYEGLFAYPALRALAQHLVEETQAAVLRFDYDGTGDSAGSDEDPERVERWLASVHAALDEIKRLAPSEGPVLVVAMRAGALLAATAASARGDVDGLVLWAPSISGRAFAREQRAFASLSQTTASASDSRQTSWGAGGFEANGYVFSDETVSALGALSFDALDASPATSILLLERAEAPIKSEAVVRWRGEGANVEVVTILDYPAMMAPPLTMSLPEDAIGQIARWTVHRSSSSGDMRLAQPLTAIRASVDPEIIEEAIWYNRSTRLFGILTVPAHVDTNRVMIFLNNAAGYRVGPHGMVPMLARTLALHGIASFRLDAAGIGDSMLPAGRPRHHPYNLDVIDDVGAALDTLTGRGFLRVAAGGLCSAAFLAWHAAQAHHAIHDLVLINPQTFHWTEGDSLDVSPLQEQYEVNHYRQSARSPEKWLKLLRGEVNLWYVAVLMLKRIVGSGHDRLQSLAVRRGWGHAGSATSRALQSIAERGGTVSFVFSGEDPGISYLQRELGASMREMLRRGYLRVSTVAGPDHSFTPRSATRRLASEIAAALGRPIVRAGAGKTPTSAS